MQNGMEQITNSKTIVANEIASLKFKGQPFAYSGQMVYAYGGKKTGMSLFVKEIAKEAFKDGQRILIIDTEQSKMQCKKVYSEILGGLIDDPNLMYYRINYPVFRLNEVFELIKNAKANLVIIDGLEGFVKSTLDEVAARELRHNLFSVIGDGYLYVTSHQGKDGNPAGHLGTIFSNSASTTIHFLKDRKKGTYSIDFISIYKDLKTETIKDLKQPIGL